MDNNEENTGMHVVHPCKGYIENVPYLSLSKETSQRARRCGFNIVDFADCCLKTIAHSVNGNSYDDLAIAECFADAAVLFLRKYQVKDIQVARFQSSDTEEESIVYLSEQHGGYIIVKRDENREPSVRATNGMEIWRYLGDPLYIVEAVISAIIAYAERHQSVKDKWLFTSEDIEEISRD